MTLKTVLIRLISSIRNSAHLFYTSVEPVPVHVKKVYRGRIGIAPLILNLGARWRSVVKAHFTPHVQTLQNKHV